MRIEDVQKSLETIYLDYYDGLYHDRHLKLLLKNLYFQVDIPIEEWSDLLLEAQWKYATEDDFETKRKQIFDETIE